MATNPVNHERQEAESEYKTWAQICLDKHGHPWPVSEEELASISDQRLAQEIKRLKALGRTPHE
jgi:hypothetical protein